MKTKAICFGVLAILITIGFASISMNSGQIKALSDTQLVKLRGGVTHCMPGCLNKFCDCETHDCEDMECMMCKYKGNTHYCLGNDEDQADVTGCWKTDTESDTCTPGNEIKTNCQVSVYSSTDTSCSQSPLFEDLYFYGDNCT